MVFFSNRQVADYTETINSNLDRIPIQRIEDFDKVKFGLEKILAGQHLTKEDKNFIGNRAIKSEVRNVRSMLNNPQNWVQNPVLYDEYKALVMNRIIDKVNEISNMTLEQKQAFIDRQMESREHAQANQVIVQAATNRVANRPPSVLTHAQWLEQEQNRYQAEGQGQPQLNWFMFIQLGDLIDDTLNFPPVHREFSEGDLIVSQTIENVEIQNPPQQVIDTVEEHLYILRGRLSGYSWIFSNILGFACVRFYEPHSQHLYSYTIPLERFNLFRQANINPYTYQEQIAILMSRGIFTLNEFINLEPIRRHFLLTNAFFISHLMNQGFTFESAEHLAELGEFRYNNNVNHDFRNLELYRNARRLAILALNHQLFSVDQFILMNDERRNFFLSNASTIDRLLNRGFSLSWIERILRFGEFLNYTFNQG